MIAKKGAEPFKGKLSDLSYVVDGMFLTRKPVVMTMPNPKRPMVIDVDFLDSVADRGDDNDLTPPDPE